MAGKRKIVMPCYIMYVLKMRAFSRYVVILEYTHANIHARATRIHAHTHAHAHAHAHAHCLYLITIVFILDVNSLD